MILIKKAFFILPILAALTFISSASCFSADTIQIFLNDTPLAFESEPILKNGRILVPLREIFQPLGFQVQWDEKTNTIRSTKPNLTISMNMNNTLTTLNGKPILLDTPPILVKNKAFVPLRFVAESTGASVQWNGATGSVSIHTKKDQWEEIAHSVVMLQTNKMQGSGFILSSDGLISTNYHVLENAKVLHILFQDGSVYAGPITLVGYAPSRDIAILQIHKENLTPVTTNDSKKFQIGDAVTAVSSPLGKLNIPTRGTILGFNDQIICTTAVTQRGSSGGALFNEKGQILGMTSSFAKTEYYAIPVEEINSIPLNLSIPLEQIGTVAYEPTAPKNISLTVSKGEAHIFWEPIYGADFYCIYISNTEKGPYTKVVNPKNQTQEWYWGFPHGFGLSVKKPTAFYLKIAVSKNGVLSSQSVPVKVKIP